MGLTERQRQCFIHGEDEQIEKAVISHYERARKSKTLQGEMYWWTAVFHANNYFGKWDQINISSRLVNEMLMEGRGDKRVKYYDRIDEIAYGLDKDIEHELRRSEKNKSGETTMIVSNPDPQMHEQQSEVILDFVFLLSEIMNVCDDVELRVLAYYLYKTELDKYLDYITDGKVNDVKEILNEIYEEEALDKQEFIAGTRWYSTKAERSLQKKIRSIL